VPRGHLLGYVKHGIKAILVKIETIVQLGKPECLQDVQKVAGRVVALSRFIPCLGKKAMPLYRLMCKLPTFGWTNEADSTLADLKKVLLTVPLLTASQEKEPMLMCIAASHRGINTVMFVERLEEGKGHPVQ
jgi:hypothetical protein